MSAEQLLSRGLSRRQVLSALVPGIGAASVVHAAESGTEGYPQRAVKLVVPFPPGGSIDVVARQLAARLNTQLGTSAFVVMNVSGASGNLGTSQVAHATPNGYTLLINGVSTVTNTVLFKDPGYRLTELDPVSLIASGPNVLVVASNQPYQNLAELISAAKAKPGRVTYAGGGSGSSPHLMGELFAQMAGLQLLHVPYRGTGPATLAVMSGEVNMMFVSALSALPQIQAGRLRALAVTASERMSVLPQVPTMTELGLNGIESGQWFGLWASGGTPASVLELLSRQVATAVRSPELSDTFVRNGMTPVGGGQHAFDQHVRSQLRMWREVISKAGIEIE